MSNPYARIRVRREQAELLYSILFRERGRLITEKIAAREGGVDPVLLRRDLLSIKYLMEEARRAKQDLEPGEDQVDPGPPADPDDPAGGW